MSRNEIIQLLLIVTKECFVKNKNVYHLYIVYKNNENNYVTLLFKRKITRKIPSLNIFMILLHLKHIEINNF